LVLADVVFNNAKASSVKPPVDRYSIRTIILLIVGKKNGFAYLFSTHEEEAESTKKSVENLKTRLMFFDLITLSAEGTK